ncbi:MAG: hypothetical protein AVDCRST_MAG12-1555, partial [uncultured Rubrobacteraceae bacterium]
ERRARAGRPPGFAVPRRVGGRRRGDGSLAREPLRSVRGGQFPVRGGALLDAGRLRFLRLALGDRCGREVRVTRRLARVLGLLGL